MRKPREIDIMMAQQVLGHHIYYEQSGAIRERQANGQSRPLRSYSLDISAAWEIVQKLAMTIIPIETGWFALVGEQRGWQSPAEFLTYLQKADFVNSGAAIGEQAPMTICLAAMKALEKQQIQPADGQTLTSGDDVGPEAVPVSPPVEPLTH